MQSRSLYSINPHLKMIRFTRNSYFSLQLVRRILFGYVYIAMFRGMKKRIHLGINDISIRPATIFRVKLRELLISYTFSIVYLRTVECDLDASIM